MIAVGYNGYRKQLLRQFIRVANTEIEALTRDRMQRLRCVAQQNGALGGDARREFKRKRERAPIGDYGSMARRRARSAARAPPRTIVPKVRPARWHFPELSSTPSRNGRLRAGVPSDPGR